MRRTPGSRPIFLVQKGTQSTVVAAQYFRGEVCPPQDRGHVRNFRHRRNGRFDGHMEFRIDLQEDYSQVSAAQRLRIRESVTETGRNPVANRSCPKSLIQDAAPLAAAGKGALAIPAAGPNQLAPPLQRHAATPDTRHPTPGRRN